MGRVEQAPSPDTRALADEEASAATASKPTVAIECFTGTFPELADGAAVVVVDVLRATTTAVTAVAAGRRCFPVATIEEAVDRAEKLDALLVGELGGETPDGFHRPNSPVAIEEADPASQPVVLLSTSGTPLLRAAAERATAVYLGTLRNHSALARRLVHARVPVALVGAGTRGEFRDEDQLCCARLAERLLAADFHPRNPETLAVVERWRGAGPEVIRDSRSVDYLRQTGQLHDLEFVLTHVDDLDAVFRLHDGEVVADKP